MGPRQFINKNMVAIVVVPLIIGAHYGWMHLQTVDVLVSKDDRKKLPQIFQSSEK
ncbi:uncharacterized protein LOC126964944 [Leptidea sinapis]|uniref:uncharacterized protein LOC126964944 n=1 Tax=Leptidea sinapis TaxID=189913 RepID=UPI0021C3CC72|nr:uncharacterized protein LOC126964944 [Leptidea sinapis]